MTQIWVAIHYLVRIVNFEVIYSPDPMQIEQNFL